MLVAFNNNYNHHVMEAGIYSSALKPRVTVVYLDLNNLIKAHLSSVF